MKLIKLVMDNIMCEVSYTIFWTKVNRDLWFNREH